VRSASITYMIRHYVARRAQVTEGHPHNAADRVESGSSAAAQLYKDLTVPRGQAAVANAASQAQACGEARHEEQSLSPRAPERIPAVPRGLIVRVDDG
jgi:hypothetical protein